MTTLHIIGGPLEGQRIEVEGELTIGREDSGLTIADGDVSRRHAVVRRRAAGLEIEDLGSKNGTFVDGQRIEGATAIDAGARVELGGTVIEVEAVEVALTGTPATAVTASAAAPVAAGDTAATATVTPPAPARPAPPATPLAAPLAPLATPTGMFHPPSRRRRQLATRSFVPVALSFGTAVLTAVALVLYFAMR